MNNWKETKLNNVIDLIIDHRGLTPKKLGGDWSDFGYRAISAKSIKNRQLVNEDQMNILSENLYKKWMKEEIQYGDVFLTSEAPLGEHIIWKSDEKLVLSQRIFGIRTNKKLLDPFFFNYFIDSKYYQHELKSRESGSTVTGIKQSELLKTKLILPSPEEQKAIAAVLSSLDDKIELLRKQNETLEKIAQSLFKRWFVEFKTDVKKIKFMNGIPEGWKFEKLAEIANITIGRTPPRKEEEWFSFSQRDRKWISIKDMGVSGIYINSTSEYLTQEAVDKFNVPAIPANTVILSFKMTVGRVAITTEEMFSNEAIAHIKLKDDFLYAEYVYLFLKRFNFNKLGSTSSIVTAVNSQSIKKMEMIIPDKQILNNFKVLIQPIFKKIYNNQLQIQTLSRLRDTLLPKLMSGEVRVK